MNVHPWTQSRQSPGIKNLQPRQCWLCPGPWGCRGLPFGRGGGRSLKPSWDKGLIQDLPSLKEAGMDACPASLPAAPSWSQSRGAQPGAAIAPWGSAAPRRNGNGGIQQSRREDGSWHRSLSSCLLPKHLHGPQSLSVEFLLYFQLQPGAFWICNWKKKKKKEV